MSSALFAQCNQHGALPPDRCSFEVRKVGTLQGNSLQACGSDATAISQGEPLQLPKGGADDVAPGVRQRVAAYVDLGEIRPRVGERPNNRVAARRAHEAAQIQLGLGTCSDDGAGSGLGQPRDFFGITFNCQVEGFQVWVGNG